MAALPNINGHQFLTSNLFVLTSRRLPISSWQLFPFVCFYSRFKERTAIFSALSYILSIRPRQQPSLLGTWQMLLIYLAALLSVFSTAQAVTVYGQIPLAQTFTAARPVQTVLAAYNDTQLTPPPVPNPAPARQFTLTLQHDATAVNGLSMPHVGLSFFGFSIEMSVVSQVRKY